MNKEEFFTGKTEKYVFGLLKEKKALSRLEVSSYYSSDDRAEGFIKKLLAYDFAIIDDSGKFSIIKWTGAKKNE